MKYSEEMWMARNVFGVLSLFIIEKPKKIGDLWINGFRSFPIDEDLFPEVKWSDEEPTKVKLEIVKLYDKNSS